VEDEPLIVKVMRRMLQGHSVIVATSASDALRKWDHTIDVALIDQNLGSGLDGLELGKLLRAISPLLRVIIMGGDLPATLPFPRLSKPFSAAELKAAIEGA